MTKLSAVPRRKPRAPRSQDLNSLLYDYESATANLEVLRLYALTPQGSAGSELSEGDFARALDVVVMELRRLNEALDAFDEARAAGEVAA